MNQSFVTFEPFEKCNATLTLCWTQPQRKHSLHPYKAKHCDKPSNISFNKAERVAKTTTRYADQFSTTLKAICMAKHPD